MMSDAVGLGPLFLILRKLAEIVAKAFGTGAVKPRPERRLADHHATGDRHAFVVVGRAGDHVDVWVDVCGHN